VEEDVDGGEDGEDEFEHEFLLKHGVTRHSQADRAETQAAILKTLLGSAYTQGVFCMMDIALRGAP